MLIDARNALVESAAGQLPSHISASQIGLFVRCPESYRHQRILGATSTRGSALTIGSGVHKGIETYLRSLNERITQGEREQRAMMAAGDSVDDADPTLHDEADEAMRLVQAWIRTAPKIIPVALEDRIEVDLPGTAATLVGYVDCVATDRLIDFKTNKSRVQKPKGDWTLQARLYQAAHGLDLDFHVIVKTKDPQVQHGADLRVRYDKDKTHQALAYAADVHGRITRLYETLGPYEPWPTDGVLHPWACSLCAARTSCPMGELA